MKTCLILEGFAFFMLHPENSSNITNDSVRQPVALKKGFLIIFDHYILSIKKG
jgi:hypothetical protein